MNQTDSFHTLTGANVRVKIVDIGANPIDGDPPYAKLLNSGIAEIVGFEPNPDALAKLNEQKGANETYLPHAVGDGRRHTLHLCQAPGMTSLLTPNPTVLNMFHGFPDWGKVMSTIEIDTLRLDDIAETVGIDLVKIDVQGAELMVFKNATERLANALVIQTEVEFLPLYVDQPLFGDVDVFLRSQGYCFHRFFPTVSRIFAPMLLDNNIYRGLSQTVWADAIFVRDITRLEVLSDRQLLAMSAILHDCYQSFDLVLKLLLEHDRRTGGKLGASYIDLLQQP